MKQFTFGIDRDWRIQHVAYPLVFYPVKSCLYKYRGFVRKRFSTRERGYILCAALKEVGKYRVRVTNEMVLLYEGKE